MKAMERQVDLYDFRGLAPPDPLVETLKRVDNWPVGLPAITAVYDRNPYLLFSELDQRQVTYHVDTRSDGVYVTMHKS